jgi:hypothetical protein
VHHSSCFAVSDGESSGFTPKRAARVKKETPSPKFDAQKMDDFLVSQAAKNKAEVVHMQEQRMIERMKLMLEFKRAGLEVPQELLKN